MIKIDAIILVEGKFDKERVKKLFDTTVISVSGFRIFKDIEKRNLLKKLSEKHSFVILTDSDSAGFLIRNHLKSFIPAEKIKNAYIPQISGKEKRKTAPSKEGLLGVEGVGDSEIIQSVLAVCNEASFSDLISLTKADLYELGLLGKENSKKLRETVYATLNLPKYLSVNAFLEIAPLITSYNELTQILTNETI